MDLNVLSKELNLRKLIDIYFSDSDFYLANKDNIDFELNHLEIHNLDDYLYNLFVKQIKGLFNKNNSNIAYLIGITNDLPTGRIKTKGGTSPDLDNFQFSPSTLQGIFNFQTIRGNNNVLDKWLLSRLHSTVKAITDALEQYDTSTAVAFMGDFVNDWSKWHVRRSRDRVGTGELTEDANEYYETTAYVFERFLRAIAPIVPFHSEYLYRKLTKEDSVHLQSWPEIDEVYVHPDLEANTAIARQICEIGHQIRKTNSWKVRHPLAKLEITIEADCSTIQENIWRTVLEELNVKNVVINGKYRYPYTEVVVTDEELKREGELRDLLREIQAMRKEKGVGINEKIQVILPEKYADYIEEVKTHIKTNTVTLGQSLEVSV